MTTLTQKSPRFSRREFIQVLGAGLLIAVSDRDLFAQVETGAPGGRRRGPANVSVSSRLHIGKDGIITVMTGKVECGQGARAQITQVAAEELRVNPDQIRLIMADTALVPDDGPSFGSQTTPNTLPRIRQGTAAARQALIAIAAQKWAVDASTLDARDGNIADAAGQRKISYADLVGDDSKVAFDRAKPAGQVTITPVDQWKVTGTSFKRPDARDLVTGRHQYPSDIVRPGMLYAKILRPPAFSAHLTKIDLSAAQSMPNVFVTHDGDFVAVAAPSSFAAQQAIDALEKTAQWQRTPQISNTELFESLKSNARGGVPKNPLADAIASAPKSLKRQYNVNYIQHAPLEPRAAVAEWQDGSLTVWTGSQNPFGVRTELQRKFNLSPDQVRVIIPDFGGGFGGKHTGEAAIEAATIAKAAGKPVWLRWTRQEEFTWAYFRPAGVILAEASLDDKDALADWFFININSGGSGVATPYRSNNICRTIPSREPLRQGSYRGLAITANNFARECFIDELASIAGADPLAFRLSHLDGTQNDRLRAALQTAAEKFNFADQYKTKQPNIGVGLACGTEKGSYVAACAAVEIDPASKTISVRKIVQAFDCGAIVNPAGLMSQVQGAIVMGLGGALREAVQFKDGVITNPSFADYLVPRFADLPELEIHLLDHREIPSAGAGETPIMAVAPAIANAVFHASGQRLHEMPLRSS